jgi:RNA polymerase sigma-70 factor (ECF subfamily)
MSDDAVHVGDSVSVARLRQELVDQYDDLKKRLTRRLGSEDMASDVLQEMYLHLERPARIGAVRNPKHYLLMIATNIARMSFRRNRRWTDMMELDAALGFVDETPNPLVRLEALQDVEALKLVIAEMTERRQRILFASRVEGVRLSDLAGELGLSERTVAKELKIALMLCGQRLKRDIVQRFGPRPREASIVTDDEKAEAAVRDAHDD